MRFIIRVESTQQVKLGSVCNVQSPFFDSSIFGFS